MKIINLQGENFKRMKAFDITPHGNTVTIAGKNGQGKTSVLDSIVMALAGKNSDVAKLNTKPIREGEKTAFVTVTTDDYIITRKWTEKDSYLEMTNKAGIAYKSPQALLDQMVGDLCFDPLEFSRMKSKEQREALLGIVKLDIDLEEWERDYKLKYDQRTAVGNQGKALQGKVDTTPVPPVDTPEEEVSIADLMKQLHDDEEHNRVWEQNNEAKVKNDARIKELEDELAQRREADNTYVTRIAALAGVRPLDELKAKLSSAEDTNRMVRQKRERAATQAEAEKYTAEYAKITQELQIMASDKALKLAGAQFPIAGLSFTDEGVTYKGIPFPQCSAAEQLKVSMAIAMAKNPKLRVIRITDGSLLDEDNMKVLAEMADKNDFQIWVEKVDSSGQVGIVISDGEVVSGNSAANA